MRRLPGPVDAVGPDDPGYPAALRTIPDPPARLYVRGHLPGDGAAAVAVVGARRATVYGVAVARHLAADLARCGVAVVSGLARGIDAAAHEGALDAGGRTVAVLGCGPDVVYPPEHASLMARVIDAGAVLSEYPPGTPPLRHHFPRRNRLISGLSLGVVIVGGREDSGALITADCALEQGREVSAVPGPVTSATSALPHRLVQQGAKLVRGVEDILEELRLRVRPPPAPPAVALAGAEAAVYAVLTLEPQSLDALVLRSRLPVAEVSRALVALELAGLARALPGQRYVRTAPGD
ncbi:MAG: DNA-processing protein DprA [Armatimonadota bacterium]|nr:DNA-processing protein DprA [Armatimonadota bacterium]